MTYAALHKHRPPHKWTFGDLAAQVGVDLGLPPDEEQQWLLDTIYAEVAPERPASFEVAVVAPRQNIKTSTFGIAALADLFVFGVERHLWTAHHGDTLAKTFADFRSWIKSNPDYDEQVQFYEGHQDMSIVHRETGATIDFQSRTGKAGRGLTGVKRITLDEALYLEPKHIGAVYPTMLTRPGAQVRIASSAGLVESEQLRRIRDRGRRGKDARLAYVEYGAPRRGCLSPFCTHEYGVAEGCALDDRDLWWFANCALWPGRIGEDSLQDMRESMPPEEFMREFLSWWEDPAGGAAAFGEGMWARASGEDRPKALPPQALALAVSYELTHGAIAAAAVTPGDVAYGKPLEHGPGIRWMVQRAKDLQGELALPVVVDGKGPAAVLLPDLEEAGVRVVEATLAEAQDACADLYERVRDAQSPRYRHASWPELDRAVEHAQRRDVGDRWLWGRKQSTDDICALEAVTLAVWAAASGLTLEEDTEPWVAFL